MGEGDTGRHGQSGPGVGRPLRSRRERQQGDIPGAFDGF